MRNLYDHDISMYAWIVSLLFSGIFEMLENTEKLKMPFLSNPTLPP